MNNLYSRRPAAFLLYGATVVLSSFLIFLIQPILAKMILPWFGGSAAVWITSLAFFQTALLVGYAYAHLVASRLPPRLQAALHIALLAAAVLSLPAIPGPSWKPEDGADPTWRILALLTSVVGVAYVLLSSTSPLVQSWFAARWPGSQPYRLFAWSNAGALIGLTSYPFLIEPRLATYRQGVIWSIAFAAFAALCAAAAWITRRSPPKPVEPAGPTPSAGRKMLWILLAAAGAMLLLATTNQLTQNVAAVPFLWILPLSIYLLTFIICFEKPEAYRRGFFLKLLAVGLGSVGYAIFDIEVGQLILVGIPVLSLGLFAGCMFCHGELSDTRPAKSHLTTYYLMIAAGGALGGVLVGVAGPRLFTGVYELPLTLTAVAGLAFWRNRESAGPVRLLWAALTVAMAIVLGSQIRGYHQNALVTIRNFYGSLRVVQRQEARTLYHGTVKHGSQFLAPARRQEPTTYYGPESGVGLTLRLQHDSPNRVGIIGLGVGTLAAYGAAGDTYRFYEINPEVIRLANTYFTYLRDTPAKVEVIPGDARLALERESPQRYHVLVADAFSGDAIPVHLLTREAFALYFQHLAPEGVLALHISNQFLDLAPAVRQSAGAFGFPAVLVNSSGDPARQISAADWILVTRNAEFLARPEVASAVETIRAAPPHDVWTDDYNNLFQALKRPN